MNVFFLLTTLLLVVACAGAPARHSDQDLHDAASQPGPVTVVKPATESSPVESAPQPVIDPIEAPAAEPVVEPDPAQESPLLDFDPTTVSAEVKEMTFTDVKRLIQNLNTIIQTRNYDLWITNLTESYVVYWSDPQILARISESPVLRRQNITLASLRDYFIHVVFPSRQNDRVDDIEFIGETRIKAIIINPKGERLVLYNLEKIGDTWKIANWR